jgi:glycosyltransferase involved in cell wall biosynthesis
MRFAINGKFTAQRITGVQRVAYELTRAMQVGDFPTDDLEVVAPQNAIDPGLSLKRMRLCSWLKGNLWEQLALPIATSRETLVSFCNSAPLLKRNQVVMIHDMAVYDVPQAFSKKFRLWYRMKFSVLHRQARFILTVSDFSKARICHHLGVDEARVLVIPNGADHLARVTSDAGVFERLQLTKGLYCVVVGSLDPRKNLQRVLDAVGKLDHLRDIKFVIAGGANPRIFGSQRVAHEDESAQIVWAGFVSDGELKALYGEAACLVFPSLYEGFGLPPLEAMYCGCPVIVSSEASLPEVCGDAAMYCDARSTDDIAAKISLMMSDAELRRNYREKGLRHAQLFRWDQAASRLLNVLYDETYARAPRVVMRPSAGTSSALFAGAARTRDRTLSKDP